ncbi:MAG: hypothetical protein PHY88_01970 [Candidatus Omnitrophica bacterium]|nr:hypothetical protein [Candidatus Omnitrophota bacterium]
MKKPLTIFKYGLVLIVIFLFTTKKPNSTQPISSVRLTGEAFAGQVDDNQVYKLDIRELEKVKSEVNKEGDDISGFPIDILHLCGKNVKLTGYLLIPYDAYLSNGDLDNFALGKNPYGCPCCNWGSSPPPTIFNVVFITMKAGEKLKPPFTPQVEVTGIFYAHQEYYTDEQGKKKIAGLFFIQDAEAKKKRKIF